MFSKQVYNPLIPKFLFQQSSFVWLSLATFTLVTGDYLITLKSKDSSTKYLIGFFLSLTVLFAITFYEIGNPKPKIGNQVIGLAPNQPTYRILVVDDEWVNRRLLRQMLEPIGFEIKEAENGQQAFTVWQTWQPHLIWLDLRMPVQDGYTTCHQIRKTASKTRPAIIAITASIVEAKQRATLFENCDGIVQKPFHEAEIFEMMAKHIGVQYIYADPIQPISSGPPKITSAHLATLPPKLLSRLASAAESGQMVRVENMISEIRQYDPTVADGLADLAKQFDYEAILALAIARDKTQLATF